MDIIAATIRKLEGAMDRAEGLLSARMVQDDSREAIKCLLDLFTTQRDELSALQQVTDPDVVEVRCNVALAVLVKHTPLLGFIHRSRSSANPFEMYDPLRALARRMIHPDIRLVVSSEWDFSPFTMPHGSTLEGFVFVGMPAAVTDKALLVPLAGHEFGHSVWVVRNVRAKLEPHANTAVWNQVRARLQEVLTAFRKGSEADLQTLEGMRTWAPPRVWALQQIEEYFCDLVGLRLFGAAYLHAFAYLLAPGLAEHRVPDYPHPRRRSELLAIAATRWGVTLPEGFVDAFPSPRDALPLSRAQAGSHEEKLLRDLADAAAFDMGDMLLTEIDDYAREHDLALPRREVIQSVCSDLAMVIPSDRHAMLPELLCAGWEVHTDAHVWASLPHILADRDRVLDDLLLKSAQILEYHERVKSAEP